MADNWMLGESAALDDYIPNAPTNILGNAAQGAKDWYTSQPSWLDRAKVENQKTLEAYGRGGMGEIAKQLATDTTEPQELYGAFGVGNIKGVRPPVAPGALAATSEYRPPFYSAVEQAVQGAKQNAAPGQQWAGYLRNQPGVKPEEVEALKLGKLFEQPGSVPKEAVLGEIAANRVNVGETVLGGERPTTFAVTSAGTGAPLRMDFATAAEANAELARRQISHSGGYHSMTELETAGSQPKFSQYTLPGGENYREMLLTLPTEDAPKAARMTALEGKLRNAGDYDTHEVNAMRREYKQLADETRASGTFKSPHYDEPNILAHVRYNDRVIDGKKTLFVEEVQSDWHQMGKKRGYQGEGLDYSIVDKGREGGGWRIMDSNGVEVAGSQDRRTAEAILRDYQSGNKRRADNRVPDAPFKTTWPELAMKRIIREAAEKGYDKVAWTPGSVQAERYDLSKQVDRLLYYPESKRLEIDARGGTTLTHENITPEKMRDIIGKEPTDRIVNNPTRKGDVGGETFYALEGEEGLKVGGEGMKGFYDEILPATVNRLVKKHGGRVQQGEITEGVQKPTAYRDYQEYADMRLKEKEGKLPKHSVHTLDITPSLRAAAMKGFPLFTAGGVAATGIMGEMARQDDYRQ